MNEATDSQEPIRLGEEYSQDPHAMYRRMRQDGAARPVILPNEWPVWVVTSYEDARALLADARLSKDPARIAKLLPEGNDGAYGTQLAGHMLNSDPPEHTRLRRLVNKAFTSRAVERLRPRIEQVADELLDAMPHGATVDLVDAYALPLPITVISELLGVPAADRDDFRDWSLTIVSMMSGEKTAEASSRMIAFLTALIEDKIASPSDDLLSELVRVSDEEGGKLSPEARSMAFLLLIAGFETTVNLIANGVLALLRHPDQLALLRSEPERLPDAIEEVLRFDGPGHATLLRSTTEPVPAGDTEIPAGQLVQFAMLSANRDGARFTDPDRFNITRRPGGHLGFGHGIHHCLGAPLARLEGQIAIGALLGRFPGIALDPATESLTRGESVIMNGLNALPVRMSS